MSSQTVLQLYAKSDADMVAADGHRFMVPKGTHMLMLFVHGKGGPEARVLVTDGRSEDLAATARDIKFDWHKGRLVVDGNELYALSDSPTCLEFATLLDHLRFDERLWHDVAYGQIL